MSRSKGCHSFWARLCTSLWGRTASSSKQLSSHRSSSRSNFQSPSGRKGAAERKAQRRLLLFWKAKGCLSGQTFVKRKLRSVFMSGLGKLWGWISGEGRFLSSTSGAGSFKRQRQQLQTWPSLRSQGPFSSHPVQSANHLREIEWSAGR